LQHFKWVQIYSYETVEWTLTGGKAKYRYMLTRIGNSCFIGSLAVIRMSVNVGDKLLVGAHSFVNSDVPSNSIVMGSPGRIIGKIEIPDGEAKLKYLGAKRKHSRKRSS